MAKQFEPNEDWIKRDEGRIPTKGAAAAERASAGLGTRTDDEALLELGIGPLAAPSKSAEQGSGSKQSGAEQSPLRPF